MTQRIVWLGISLVVVFISCSSIYAADNTLMPSLEQRGWKLLFNGSTLDNWEYSDPNAWIVDDNAICYTTKGGGMIRSKEQYDNFALMVDFKVDKGSNSGIFFHWANPNDPVQTGIEMQVLDSAGKAKPDKHDCGAIYDCLEPSVNTMKPAGEWNKCVITCCDNWIDVKLNGKQIIHMDLDQWTTAHKNPDGTPNKFNTAYKDMPRTGYIGFQDHGGKVWYRNVMIKHL